MSKKNKQLISVIILNIIFWGITLYYKIHTNQFLIIILILDRCLLLPITWLYFSNLIYTKSNKNINKICNFITIITFFIIIDPGIMSIPWAPSGLLRFVIFQKLSYKIPYFFYILWLTYIVILNTLLKFIWNQIIKYTKK